MGVDQHNQGGRQMASGDKPEAIGTTTIGPTIIIRGRLKVHENLTVRGRIEAEISSSQTLIVESSGIVKADVRVQSAKISGVLVGNITAEEKIEIASDGRVVGDLRAPRIVINDGAAFRGKIDMQSLDEQRASEPDAAAAPAIVAVPTAAPQQLPAAIPPPDALARAPHPRTAPKSGGRN
jgi:cytoskeletal protein CcmA (bactofilin family)